MADKITPGGDYDKACYQVGRFIYHFALLESAINDAIGKLLGMGTFEEAIATFNMQFRAKTNILKAIVNLKGGNADWAKQALKDIEAIVTLSTDRNTAVHTVFGPDGKDAVRFLTVKARDELKYPETIWRDSDFEQKWQQAVDLRVRVEEMVKRLVKGFSLEDLVSDWAKTQALGPATGNYLGRLLLGTPDSQPPTSEESSQTQQEPQGK
jgi:hypothetical protein